MIYAFTFHNFFWSLEETKIVKRNLDGTPVAELKMPTFAQSGPVILSNYFIVSNGAALSAVSPDLKVLWTFKGKETFWATGLEHEGIFYVGDRDGYVYALRLPKL